MARRRKTFWKVFWLNLVTPMAIFIAVAAVIAVLQYNQLFALQKERLIQIGDAISGRVGEILSENMQLIEDASRSPQVIAALRDVPAKFDREYWETNPTMQAAVSLMNGLAGEDGVRLVYLGSPKTPQLIPGRLVDLPGDYDARTRPWYQNAITSSAVLVTDPYVTAEQGVADTLVHSYAMSVIDNGQRIGVVALDTTFARVEAAANAIAEESGLSLSIFSRASGKFVFGATRSNIGMPVAAVAQALGYDEASIPALLDSLFTRAEFYFEGASTEFDGVAMIQSVQIHAYSDWGILLVAPRSVVAARVRDSVLAPMGIMGGVFLIFLLGAFLLTARTLIRPLTETSASLSDLAEGDGDLTARVPVRTNDDIGALSENFNLFADKTQHMVRTIKSAAEEESRVSEDLTSAVEETSAAINEIIANIDSIHIQIRRLDESVAASASAIEQITRNIVSVTDQVSNQAAMVEETSSSITEMMSSLDNVASITERKTESVKLLSDAANAGKQQLEETTTNFYSGVVGHMGAIREMAGAIQNIASQTNILSMNAAIEAAHAGDAGRGFSVVAEEIRKLADEAAGSSAEIARTVSLIAKSVEETRRNQDETGVQFDRILEEVEGTRDAFAEISTTTRELSIGGSEITRAVTSLNDITSGIHDGASEIRDGSGNVLQAQTEVRDISMTVAGGMSEIAAGATEIGRAMSALGDLNRSLLDTIASLRTEVGRFRTE